MANKTKTMKNNDSNKITTIYTYIQNNALKEYDIHMDMSSRRVLNYT